jgi:hypothetical protein
MLIQRILDGTNCPKRTINGCTETNNADSTLLTRYFLIRTKRCGNLYLHIFHRSDEDRELHDHPWTFISLMLWNGYYEVTPKGRSLKLPGAILYRPATWRHRVELRNDKPSVSLVWVSQKSRTWGFFTDRGWIPFYDFFKDKGCK